MSNTWQYTAEELGVKWLEWQRDVRHRPATTWRRYGRTLNLWLKWCEDRAIDALSPELEDLERFIIRIRNKGQMGKPATQHMDATVLRSWYDWLFTRNHIPTNPAKELIPVEVPATAGKPLPENVWIALWAQDLSPVTRAALGMGYFAGLRTFEIEQTPKDRIGPELIHVVRKGGKMQSIPWRKLSLVIHHRIPRLLPDADLFARAVQYVKDRSGARNSTTLFPFDFKDAFERLVRPFPEHCTAHMLRHSMVTNLLSPEVQMPIQLVQEYAGHASINDTRRYIPETGEGIEKYFPEILG